MRAYMRVYENLATQLHISDLTSQNHCPICIHKCERAYVRAYMRVYENLATQLHISDLTSQNHCPICIHNKRHRFVGGIWGGNLISNFPEQVKKYP